MRGVLAAGGGHGRTSLKANRSVAEPPIRSREDLKFWLIWAKGEAKVHAEMSHPRLKKVQEAEPSPPTLSQFAWRNSNEDHRHRRNKDTIAPISVVKLPLCSSPDDVNDVLGVGVRLYFDLQKLLTGLSIIGILCMLPSYIASFENIGMCRRLRRQAVGSPSQLQLP